MNFSSPFLGFQSVQRLVEVAFWVHLLVECLLDLQTSLIDSCYLNHLLDL